MRVDALQRAEIVYADSAVSDRIRALAQAEIRDLRGHPGGHGQGNADRSPGRRRRRALGGRRRIRSTTSAVREALAVARTVVPFDIVPGLSIAAGTAAYAGMPVGSVHTEADLRRCRGGRLRPLARSPGTLLLTVPADQVTYVGEQLVSGGLKPDTPVTVTSDGTGTGQHTAPARSASWSSRWPA